MSSFWPQIINNGYPAPGRLHAVIIAEIIGIIGIIAETIAEIAASQARIFYIRRGPAIPQRSLRSERLQRERAREKSK